MKTNILNTEFGLPLVVESEDPLSSDELMSWYDDHRDWVTTKLHKHGALLFRGFGIDQQEIFAKFSKVANRDLLEYVDGNSPRTKLQSGIYTSTEYPKEFFISMHNELSYCKTWPARIYFCCVTPAATGGETPLVDGRALLQRLGPEITGEFRRRKVKYIRNLHGGQGFGPSWQKTFQTEDRAGLEAYAQTSGMDVEWKPDGGVRLSNVHDAIVAHPQTGEEVWFNQADQFHPSTHPAEVRESMELFYQGREDQLPQNATFGDDTPIDPAMLDRIREVTRELLVLCSWQRGDLIVADNTLVSHGRMPFEGERKVLVAMSGS